MNVLIVIFSEYADEGDQGVSLQHLAWMPAAQVQHGGGERIRVGAPDDAGQAAAEAAVSACGQRVGDVDGVGHAVRHCARAVHVPADGSAHCSFMVVIDVMSSCSCCSLC